MDHEGTSLRSALHLAARRARLRGVGLSSSSVESAAEQGAVEKHALAPPPTVDAERSRLNSLVSEALRAQPAVGVRIGVIELESVAAGAASAGHSFGPELPSLPRRKNAQPRGEHAAFEVKVELVAAAPAAERERAAFGEKVELVAAAPAAERKRADLAEAVQVEPAECAERVGHELPVQAASAESVEGALRAGSIEWVAPIERAGGGAEREARSEPNEREPNEREPNEREPNEREPAAADTAHDIDIDIDIDIDLEDLDDPRAGQRRLLYFLRDRFINAPERVDAALQAYRGKYSSIAEYVRDVISVEPMADWLRPYIDIDTLARDWRHEGIIWAIDDPGGNGEGPGVYVFLG